MDEEKKGRTDERRTWEDLKVVTRKCKTWPESTGR
jgi:hypothetical protein